MSDTTAKIEIDFQLPNTPLFYQYLQITLMYKDRPQGSFCKPIDEAILFLELNDTGETTKQSGEWFKVEFIRMTEEEYNNLPEFSGF